MYCPYCKNRIDDRSARCPYCGRDLYAPPQPPYPAPYSQPYPAPQPPMPPYYAGAQNAQIVYRTGCNQKIRGRVVRGIVSPIIFIVIAIVLVILFATDTVPLDPDDDVWFYTVLASGAIGSIVSLIIYSAQLGVVNQTQLTVTHSGIYGSGGPAKYNSVITFNLTYDQIFKVSTLPNHLVIDSVSGKIYCLVENPGEAEYIIDNERRMYTGRPY